MQTEETEFWLYLTELNKQALTRFIRTFEQKHNNVKIEVNRVNNKDEFVKQEGNVIVSELGEIPHWQVVILTPVESLAYEVYCLCMNQGWNVCLYAPKAEAVLDIKAKDTQK